MSGITIGGKHFSRRTINYFLTALSAALVIFLLYKGQIALLYVLATVGVTALMVIVALADLSGAKQPGIEQTEEASNER